MNKNFAVFGLVAIIMFSLVASRPTTVSADWLLDRTGTLIQIDPRILGDDDDENEIELEDEVEDEKEKEQERIREAAKKQTEVTRRASDKAKEELKRKIEINQIKSKTNKMEKESEIEVGGDKLKIKQKIKDANGKETETEMQLENGEELQVESKNGDEAKKFKLRARQDDSVEVEKDGVKVGTKLPIGLNENNELVVTRPDGTTKIVAVMPDQALKMLREQNFTPDDTATDANSDSTDLPELEEEDGQPVYKIDGEKQEKILGIFKIAYRTKAIVSAETGQLVRTELSGFDRFMSLFSF